MKAAESVEVAQIAAKVAARAAAAAAAADPNDDWGVMDEDEVDRVMSTFENKNVKKVAEPLIRFGTGYSAGANKKANDELLSDAMKLQIKTKKMAAIAKRDAIQAEKKQIAREKIATQAKKTYETYNRTTIPMIALQIARKQATAREEQRFNQSWSRNQYGFEAGKLFDDTFFPPSSWCFIDKMKTANDSVSLLDWAYFIGKPNYRGRLMLVTFFVLNGLPPYVFEKWMDLYHMKYGHEKDFKNDALQMRLLWKDLQRRDDGEIKRGHYFSWDILEGKWKHIDGREKNFNKK